MNRPASEQVVIQSPLSYTGSAKRLWRIGSDTHPAVRWTLAPLLAVAILLAWCAVTLWYVLFGFILGPWRLIRRGSRKRKQAELRHRELLEQRDNR